MKSLTLRSKGVITALLATVVLVAAEDMAQAVPAKDTNTSGDWNTPGNWNPAGVPVSGSDSVNIDLSMSVSTNTSFGSTTAADDSIWNSNTITVNSGFTLEHIANSTLIITGANPFLAGAGTFLNSGTIYSNSPRLLFLSGSSTFDNSGLFEFQGTDAKVVLFDLSSPSFVNNGDININMTNATNRAIIYNEQSGIGNGTFVQEGNAITWTQGTLVFSPTNLSGSGTGTSITDASFPLLFDTTTLNGGNAQLRLGGAVDITLDTNVTDLSNVYLGDTTGSVRGTTSGTTINVTGDGIRTSTAAGGQINVANASEFVTNLGTIVVENNGGQFWINGNGTFFNQGTMIVENNRFLLGVSGNTVLQNEGDIIFTENNSRIDMWTGTPTFINAAGGKLSVQLPNVTDIARVATESGNLDTGYGGQYLNLGGDPMEFVKGTFVMAPPAGIGTQLNDATFASMFGPLNADSRLRISGGINDIELTGATDLTYVGLGDNSQQLHVPAGGTTVNVTAPGGIKTSDGVAQFRINTGRELTNLGTMVVTSGQQLFINGDGTLRNEGTMVVQSNRFLLGVSGNPTFDNVGTIQFTENNSRIDLWAGTPSFNNLADGFLQVNLPLGTSTSDIGRDTSATSGTFSNAGTIEILQGELVIETGINTTAVTAGGSTLATGTWRILADGARSRLDFEAGGTNVGDANQLNFDGSITTIGAGAKLVISSVNGGSAEFPQLGAVSNVAGEMYVHGDLVMAVDSALAVTGTIGGDATLGTAGTISLNGGVLDPSALDGTAGTLTINGNLSLSNSTELAFGLGTPNIIGSEINDLIEVNGDLVLDGILDVTNLGGFSNGTYRLFNYTGTLTDNGIIVSDPNYIISLSTAGQVNLLVVPEPSSALLLFTGILFFRRKRKTSPC